MKKAAGRTARTNKQTAARSINDVISLADAASLLGRTKQWVNKLERDGWIAKADRGRYRLVDVVQGYARFLSEERKSTTKNAAQVRLQEARAREIEQRTAREEHALIEVAEAIACLDEIVGALRAELDGLPARFSRDLAQRRELEALLHDIFHRAAARLEERSSALRAGGEADPADGEDDA